MKKHNVPYELAFKLQVAGFPLKCTRGVYEESPHSLPDPTSDELIEACFGTFEKLEYVAGGTYIAVGDDGEKWFADTPAEALAKLWLSRKEDFDGKSKHR
jgi:hypothetical protein